MLPVIAVVTIGALIGGLFGHGWAGLAIGCSAGAVFTFAVLAYDKSIGRT